MTENFENLLTAGQCNALLRHSLGTANQAEEKLDETILGQGGAFRINNKGIFSLKL